ncbi:MAG: GMC family oxidoreductase [Myxococcota bacterium]|jgi:choline dehydrogenase-like flavoprotein|nr:GMC family oxidoreductase [Myxococcota bacterium]
MAGPTGERFDAIVVGTGFASSFFLHRLLRGLASSSRVLVLEAGRRHAHSWQLQHPRALEKIAARSFINRTPAKPWVVQRAFGGGSNCWWACTPRLLPSDFALHSNYGVATDWPISYDELEPLYSEAEWLMDVAGPSDDSPFPRSRPYPQPAHRMSDPDKLLKRAFPDAFFAQPTARPSRTVAGKRAACCNNGVCELCPIDSKFTVHNSMGNVYADPRVTLVLGARVDQVDIAGDRAEGVVYTRDGREEHARADLVALGANALSNPHVLLRSGDTHALLGRRLHEQTSLKANVLLDGVDNFQGGTSITGHGYMLYDGPHRSERPAILLETWNVPRLRNERGKWRQLLKLMCIIEQYPRRENRVEVSSEDSTRPAVSHAGHGPEVARAVDALQRELPRLMAKLPIEDVRIASEFKQTEAHALGTVVMGNDPATSVVDRHLIHHRIRNLLVLGGSAFPTASPANPTLTISALSLFAAEHLLS